MAVYCGCQQGGFSGSLSDHVRWYDSGDHLVLAVAERSGSEAGNRGRRNLRPAGQLDPCHGYSGQCVSVNPCIFFAVRGSGGLPFPCMEGENMAKAGSVPGSMRDLPVYHVFEAAFGRGCVLRRPGDCFTGGAGIRSALAEMAAGKPDGVFPVKALQDGKERAAGATEDGDFI